MTFPPFVSLTGYRGTGKNAVGRVLAERLAYQFHDTDQMIVVQQGQSIARIFVERGEPAFRDLESELIGTLVGNRQVVVALGGGAILRESNRRSLKAAGPVIWLQASAATIRQRLADDPASSAQRPSLTQSGLLDEIEQVLSERMPLYSSTADFSVDTDGVDPEQVARKIESWLKRTGR